MPALQMQIQGGPELQRALEKIDNEIAKKIMRKAAQKATTPWIRSARNKVKPISGTAARALGRRYKFYRNTATHYVIVGMRKGYAVPKTGGDKGGKPGHDPRHTAHLIERGTKPHTIPAPVGGLKIGPVIIKGAVRHPGTEPHPFMRPAFEENKRGAVTIVTQEIRGGLNKVARTFQRHIWHT